MAADGTDQPGVLGNLPRSRPGKRSEKRASGARAVASTRAKATTRPRPAAKRKPATTRKPSATRKPAATAPPRERSQAAAPAPASSSPDPLTAAVRAAGKVAEVGLKTAGSILRRLPGR